MKRRQVLLLFGGESNEHDVSVMSAHNVYAALDNEKYDVILCLIDRIGRWWLVDHIHDTHIGKPQLLPAVGQRQFVTLPGLKVVHPDVILPILHGKNGEDGSVQHLAELLHIPCAGPSAIGAAATNNKDITKKLLRDAGLNTAPWMIWNIRNKRPLYSEVVNNIGEVLFIKPVSSGSSVGIAKVHTAEEFAEALSVAAKHDDFVMIEQYVAGREIEVAVLGNDVVYVSQPGEVTPGEDFYTYDDKYSNDSRAKITIPANLPQDIINRIRETAQEAYAATYGHGMARVDMFLTPENQLIVGEINSIPGFTNISMYPKLWQAEGLKYPDLIDKLISLAVE